MILVDSIATHPKITRAGELLGGAAGIARALSMYVASIGYARTFLTDGFIPHTFVKANPVCSRGEAVAKALCDPRVRLWERERKGYRIHDFAAFNESAREIKSKRAKERARVAAYRARKTGNA